MAPQRKTADENGTSKEKNGSGSGSGVTKSKKSANASGLSSLKDVTNAASPVENGANGSTSNGQAGGQKDETLDFNALPRHSLHAYRLAYGLNQPSSFRNFHNGILLSSRNGVGLRSPTMLRNKEKRRVPKRVLARAVRAHFMDQSVSELDVEARMMYNVKSLDKAFRMKFHPQLPLKK